MRIPMTIANWFRDTKRPLLLRGATSETYIGVRAEARPIASPPMNLAVEKPPKLFEHALPIAESVKRRAALIRLLRLPSLSLSLPAPAAPIKQPKSNELAAISV